MELKYVLNEWLISELKYQSNLTELLSLLNSGLQQLVKLRNEKQKDQQIRLTENICNLSEIIANIKPLIIENPDFDEKLTQKILYLSASPNEQELFLKQLKFSYEQGHFTKYYILITRVAVRYDQYREFIKAIFPLDKAGIIQSHLITLTQRFPRVQLLVERMIANVEGTLKTELQVLSNFIGRQIADINAAVGRERSPAIKIAVDKSINSSNLFAKTTYTHFKLENNLSSSAEKFKNYVPVN